ncbi:MAG: glycosyltransferase [Saprospirales bacterium]|nr:glycosyltransferase [Saprospirales bacterium]
MTRPKISIVTPCFNQVHYIEETIRSVLDQAYPNLEYIIIDGGSTDGTAEIIKKIRKQPALLGFEPDAGMYDAVQKGFEKSSGELMAWINSDDLLHRGALNTVSEIFPLSRKSIGYRAFPPSSTNRVASSKPAA